MDDRKSKLHNDERERERRLAHASAMAQQAALQASSLTTSDPSLLSPMPGAGHRLSNSTNDGPPPYEPSEDDD